MTQNFWFSHYFKEMSKYLSLAYFFEEAVERLKYARCYPGYPDKICESL